MKPQKVPKAVTPAKAGVKKWLSLLDSRFRGNDDNVCFPIFYKTINIQYSIFNFQFPTTGQRLRWPSPWLHISGNWVLQVSTAKEHLG
jgi:hypothetical protein